MDKERIIEELKSINDELLRLSNQLDSVSAEIKRNMDELLRKRDALSALANSSVDPGVIMKAVSLLEGSNVGTPGGG